MTVNGAEQEQVIIVVYVDDITIYGSDKVSSHRIDEIDIAASA